MTAISKVSSGNPVPNPLLKTISDVAWLHVRPRAAGCRIQTLPAQSLVTFNNLTLTGASGTFGTANITLTGTDSAANKLTDFLQPHNLFPSECNAVGNSVPTRSPKRDWHLCRYATTCRNCQPTSNVAIRRAMPPVGAVYWFPNGSAAGLGGAGTLEYHNHELERPIRRRRGHGRGFFDAAN